MTRKEILLLHGFISSGQSTKARYVGERFETTPDVAFHAVDFNPTSQDFAYMTVTGRIERMLLLAPALSWLSGGLTEEELRQWEEADAVSIFHPAFGKEVPLRYDLQLDGRRYREPIPPPALVTIIHGRDDRTVPIDHSRAYAATYPDDVCLVEVGADHDLNGHLDMIWEHVQSFLLEDQGGL